jgi:hypothetical protein
MSPIRATIEGNYSKSRRPGRTIGGRRGADGLFTTGCCIVMAQTKALDALRAINQALADGEACIKNSNKLLRTITSSPAIVGKRRRYWMFSYWPKPSVNAIATGWLLN